MRTVEGSDDTDALLAQSGVRRVAVAVGFVLFGVAWVLVDRFEAAQRAEPLSVLELLVALAACVLLLWRRRAPVRIAVVVILVAAFIPGAAGAALLALFSLAVRRSPRWTVPLGAAYVVAVIVGMPGPIVWNTDALGQVGVAVVLAALAIVGGTTVRNRRRLIASLVALASSAESVERERVERVRAEERSLLAGEMHDVLAHRMSLVAIHAGALEYAAGLPAAETQRAAGVIRAGVHQMLVDLRDVIGMLRDESTERDALGPTPTLSDVDVLFRDSASAGYPVDAVIDIDEVRDALPVQVDRAAYRVVQEGLTNARKHGGGPSVSVLISGSFDTGLAVRISQPMPPGALRAVASVPGSGTGLIGLVERATLVGGTVEFGRHDAAFILSACFPLETHA
ncbi:sensor histidine kinase [Plantibacter sp. RU18]|uniref:sensor histidine kinase n=1 Tax=Plantibacter sp. RU18 TaxID=3158143 RepID=UPI003D35E7D4